MNPQVALHTTVATPRGMSTPKTAPPLLALARAHATHSIALKSTIRVRALGLPPAPTVPQNIPQAPLPPPISSPPCLPLRDVSLLRIRECEGSRSYQHRVWTPAGSGTTGMQVCNCLVSNAPPLYAELSKLNSQLKMLLLQLKKEKKQKCNESAKCSPLSRL